jgi:primosomal replication protein N
MNQLSLSGEVLKAPRKMVNIAGVTHWMFTLTHRSDVISAGVKRNVFCALQLILSGDNHSKLLSTLTIGSKVQAQGCLAWQKGKTHPGRHVMHVDSIQLIS